MSSLPTRYLIIPGWQGSSAEHWQSHWQNLLPNAVRVEQDNWLWPQRNAWVARLDQQIGADPSPAILIAHSLGCIAVAHWAAQADPQLLGRVAGALLVAPADVERPGCPTALRGFAPIPQSRLPFASLLIGSDNDPAASTQRALAFAQAWGSHSAIIPQAGHINAQAGFNRWERGFAYLYQLQRQSQQLTLRRA